MGYRLKRNDGVTVWRVSNLYTELARLNETNSPSSRAAYSLVRGDRLHLKICLCWEIISPVLCGWGVWGSRNITFGRCWVMDLVENSGNESIHIMLLQILRRHVAHRRHSDVCHMNTWVSCSSKTWECIWVSRSYTTQAPSVTVILGSHRHSPRVSSSNEEKNDASSAVLILLWGKMR